MAEELVLTPGGLRPKSLFSNVPSVPTFSDNGHRLVTSGSVASDPIILHYGDNRMPRLANTHCGEGAKKPTWPDDKRDLVITPAGPMPREKVHPVGPNEIVRRNEDGTYTIVPKPDRRHKEERS